MSAVPTVELALVVLLAAAVTLYVLGSRRIATILGALVLGPVCYFVVGISVPRFTGEGRFFSVPFGGLHVGDSDLVLGILTWILIWWALLHYILVVRRRRSPSR